jgi:tRNA 2-selenouridine synthase
MPNPPASLFSAVHPFQLEVQDFETYALLVDARAATAFADDHLPGAVSVPCEAVCTTSAGETVRRVPVALQEQVARLSAGDSILVYCDRGGLDAQAYAEPLRRIGWAVDVLPGGWSAYRRWVTAGLEVLPRGLGFRCLVAPPMSGLCVILPLLREQGEQVLDLPDLAGQRLVPGLTLLGDETLTQEAFETRLLDVLRRFDPERAVWVSGCSELPAGLALPRALHDALSHAEAIHLEVPIDQRARLWF